MLGLKAESRELTIPSCDFKNSKVFMIRNVDDWKHINDMNKTIFCVKSGDYSSLGHINLTRSGTREKKRYILLDNRSKLHPSKLKKSDLAKVAFKFNNTNYWVLDRLSYTQSDNAFIPIVLSNSDHNIISRYFVNNVKGGAIVLHPNSDENIIVNCRIQRTEATAYLDRAAIELNNNGKDNISIKNNKIINNEIVNAVDGIQLVKTGNVQQRYINYEGTLIKNNHISINKSIYTDCQGSLQVDGSCAFAENAIDLKAGSENKNNPVVISNNKLWGFKKSDTVDYTKENNRSTLSDLGVVIPIHYNAQHIVIKNNLFFNSSMGLAIDGKIHGYAAQNIRIENNIFYNIYSSAIYATFVKNIIIKNNSFQNICLGNNGRGEGVYDAIYFNDSSNVFFEKNKIINAYKPASFYVKKEKYNSKNSTYYQFKNNLYRNASYTKLNNDYEKSIAILDSSDLVFDKNNAYKDLIFTTDKFSKKIKKISLQKVMQ
jgi:hypothetical protein